MIVSLIWARRNHLRVGDSLAPLWKINSMAVDNLLEFQRASSTLSPIPKAPSSVKRTPPPAGWVKVNFDGATFKERNLAGLGCIIRNDKGLVMAAFTQFILLPTSVETVEVLAARSAVGFTQELSLEQLILEGDSESIIKALAMGGRESSSFGHIIMAINSISSAFKCISFSHTRRRGNKVAYRPARLACKFSHFHVWMEEVPPDVESVYLSDFPS